MFERPTLRLIRPAPLARALARNSVSAKALNWRGFSIGLLAATLICQHAFLAVFSPLAHRACAKRWTVRWKARPRPMTWPVLWRSPWSLCFSLAFFAACGLWLYRFASLAYGIAALCDLTLRARVLWGIRAFADSTTGPQPESHRD